MWMSGINVTAHSGSWYISQWCHFYGNIRDTWGNVFFHRYKFGQIVTSWSTGSTDTDLIWFEDVYFILWYNARGYTNQMYTRFNPILYPMVSICVDHLHQLCQLVKIIELHPILIIMPCCIMSYHVSYREVSSHVISCCWMLSKVSTVRIGLYQYPKYHIRIAVDWCFLSNIAVAGDNKMILFHSLTSASAGADTGNLSIGSDCGIRESAERSVRDSGISSDSGL